LKKHLIGPDYTQRGRKLRFFKEGKAQFSTVGISYLLVPFGEA
jgi:hypothetical protein